MSISWRLSTAVVGVLLAIAAPLATPAVALRAGQRAPDPDLPTVLGQVADYLDRYDAAFSAVVSEEHYEQVLFRRATSTSRRTLRSDVIVMNGGPAGWLAFRDVFEVDEQPVRDRDDRLANVFLHPQPDAFSQAVHIADEGARFNIGPVIRTINVPTMALSFLRGSAQPRSTFRLDGTATRDGLSTVILRFDETATPRMIRTSDGVAARGRAWIQSGTGRVVRTELIVNSIDARAEIAVSYEAQERLNDLWAPVRMDESYSIAATQSIVGTAKYSNFRQFEVDVATVIKK